MFNGGDKGFKSLIDYISYSLNNCGCYEHYYIRNTIKVIVFHIVRLGYFKSSE